MSRERNVSIGVLVVLLVGGAIAWRRCVGGAHDHSGPKESEHSLSGVGAGGRAATAAAKRTADPRTLAHGSIAGTIRDEHGAPLAGASVCATWGGRDLSTEETREPICATSDARGAYALAELVPAQYGVSASAGSHGYASWEDAEHHQDFRLAAAEARTGVDIALPGGAIEVKGVVDDINGGPIAGALVTIRAGDWFEGQGAGGYVRTKDDGTFSVWSKPGELSVSARAEGYTTGSKQAAEPGSFVEVLLTPEGVLAGTVVEAGTKKPVAGAMVEIDPEWESGGSYEGTQSARSDADGKFKITRLAPGRYKPTAKGAAYYGEPAESVRLALGQTIDDVVIEVHPAVTVRGRVVVEGAGATRTPCARAQLWMQDHQRNLSRSGDTDPDGTIEVKSVLPGKYTVQVWCEKKLSKDHYDPIEVVAKDIDGLEWIVTAGGTIRGRVHSPTGEPIAGAHIQAETTGGDPRGQRSWGWEKTEKDGTFVVTGLVAGVYSLRATADGYPQMKDPVKITVPASGEATADLTLDGGGTIHGVVVDEGGHGVAGVSVKAQGARWQWWSAGARTADDGSFTMKGVDPGPARVVAQRGWSDELRDPGKHDDDTSGKKVAVVAGQTVEVRLVVESQSGAIAGVVVDSKGAAVADAYITSQRESDSAGAAAGSALRQSRWNGWDKRPVVTATDGSFRVTDLAPGDYTLRAYRKGGGEAVAEHVAVGGRARLEMKAAGSIAGQVAIVGGGQPDVFFASVSDRKTGFSRSEGFYMTGGKWALRDLPAGTYTVTVTAAEGRSSVDVPLADGEDKTDVQLMLEKLVTVRGRFVELGGGAPVPGLAATVVAAKSDDGFEISFDGDADGARKFISDAAGRFEVERAPIGRDMVQAFSMDWENSPFGFVRKLVVVKEGVDELDVGDIEVPRRKLPARDRGGEVGFAFVEQDPTVDPEAYELKVSHIDADGPAVKSGLAVGDVIVSVDGVDVRGDRSYLAWTLLQLPQGATVKLGLARGATIAITVAAPA